MNNAGEKHQEAGSNLHGKAPFVADLMIASQELNAKGLTVGSAPQRISEDGGHQAGDAGSVRDRPKSLIYSPRLRMSGVSGHQVARGESDETTQLEAG